MRLILHSRSPIVPVEHLQGRASKFVHLFSPILGPHLELGYRDDRIIGTFERGRTILPKGLQRAIQERFRMMYLLLNFNTRLYTEPSLSTASPQMHKVVQETGLQ